MLKKFANPINAALETVDPTIKIIAEPGRYYVDSAFISAARVIGKKMLMQNGQKTFMYYVSDGVYGTFIEELLDIKARHPVLINAVSIVETLSFGEEKKNSEIFRLQKREQNEKYVSTMWGPTCDSYDCLLKEELLPEYYVGDWLAWYDVGAYGISLSNGFNGFGAPKVYPVMRRFDW